MRFMSLFLIPHLYKVSVFFFVPTGVSVLSIYNILLSACWIRGSFIFWICSSRDSVLSDDFERSRSNWQGFCDVSFPLVIIITMFNTLG